MNFLLNVQITASVCTECNAKTDGDTLVKDTMVEVINSEVVRTTHDAMIA